MKTNLKNKMGKFLRKPSSCLALALLSLQAIAVENIGMIKSIQGDVYIDRAGKKQVTKAADPIYSTDTIETGVASLVGITFKDESLISLGPNSKVEISKYAFDPTTHQGSQTISLKTGSLSSISGKLASADPKNVQFSTKTVTLGVRGTQFIMEANQTGANEGISFVTDSSGTPITAGDGCLVFGSSQGSSNCNPDRFVLLPDRSGKVGAISLSQEGETQIVSEAYVMAQMQDDKPIALIQKTQSDIESQYAAVIKIQPPSSQKFILRFINGSAQNLTEESIAELTVIQRTIEQWPVPFELMVIGHTDSVGNLESNDRLSKQRAQTVSALLENAGVPSSRIESVGRGEREPLVKTADEVPEALNRRVEVVIR